MGMTKASLDLQIQQQTQKSITELESNMKHLEQVCRIIDMNMRQSHAVLWNDVTQLRFRVNFMMGELKRNMTEEQIIDLEARFKEFATEETKKMDKQITDALSAKEKALAEQKEAEEAKSSVIQ
jgi:hypothetical protein